MFLILAGLAPLVGIALTLHGVRERPQRLALAGPSRARPARRVAGTAHPVAPLEGPTRLDLLVCAVYALTAGAAAAGVVMIAVELADLQLDDLLPLPTLLESRRAQRMGLIGTLVLATFLLGLSLSARHAPRVRLGKTERGLMALCGLLGVLIWLPLLLALVSG